MATSDFYDTLAPYYHLIYEDWEVSIGRQSRGLDAIIRSTGGPRRRSVLDTSCGIGTQSMGLAQLGYEVTASDQSPSAVERAQREASRRGLSIQCSVADMRGVHAHHRRLFSPARFLFRRQQSAKAGQNNRTSGAFEGTKRPSSFLKH